MSLFPRAFGYNIWCTGWETLHFEETSPIWGYSEVSWLGSSRGGRRLALLERLRFLMPGPSMLSGQWTAAWELNAQVRKVPTLWGGRGGLINPWEGVGEAPTINVTREVVEVMSARSWVKFVRRSWEGFWGKKLGLCVLIFCPPLGGAPSAVEFSVPSELSG